MIPLCIPDLSGNEARYLQECIDTTFVSSTGAFVTRFESMVAEAAGAPFATATASGTSAIHLALLAVGVDRDDLVIMPSYTFIASANAVSHCGAKPWLFDVSSEGWTLDPVLLADTLSAETERTEGKLIHRPTGRRVAAILPVQTLGIPADMGPIVETARAFGLPVVSDAAAALGATYKGLPPGQWGADLTAFSFNGNKTVTCGGGGMVVGADGALVNLARHLATTARSGMDYTHDRIGFNFRMTNLEAAVGCAQMERLDKFSAAKRHIAATYAEAFAAFPQIQTFPEPAWGESAHWLSGVVMPDAAAAAALREHLPTAGIDARPFWKPVHLQKPYADCPTTRQDVAEALWSRVVTLPCSTNITAAQLDMVVDAVNAFLTRHLRPNITAGL